MKHPALLGIEQHVSGKTILDAPAGVAKFALGVNRDALGLEAQRDDRRVPDQREDRLRAMMAECGAHGVCGLAGKGIMGNRWIISFKCVCREPGIARPRALIHRTAA